MGFFQCALAQDLGRRQVSSLLATWKTSCANHLNHPTRKEQGGRGLKSRGCSDICNIACFLSHSPLIDSPPVPRPAAAEHILHQVTSCSVRQEGPCVAPWVREYLNSQHLFVVRVRTTVFQYHTDDVRYHSTVWTCAGVYWSRTYCLHKDLL